MARAKDRTRTDLVQFLTRNRYHSEAETRAALNRLVSGREIKNNRGKVMNPEQLVDQIRVFAKSKTTRGNRRYWCESANFSQIATAFEVTITENDIKDLEGESDFATVERVGRRIIHLRGVCIHPDVHPQAVFPATNRFEDRDKRLGPIERAALARLAKELNKAKGRLFNISARINSGLSSVLWEIHKDTNFRFRRAIHIRPGPGATEFEALLRAALPEVKLDLPAEDGSPNEKRFDGIIAALNRAHVLLVVHNIHFWYDIPSGPDPRFAALEAARRASVESFELFADKFQAVSGHNSALLVTSADDFAPRPGALQKKGFHELSIDTRVSVTDQPEETLNELIESFRRILFGEGTNGPIEDDLGFYEAEPAEGPRMRRFKTHLHRLRVNNKERIPIATLRLRAAGFADPSTRSEADPTQGFSFLVPKALAEELPTFSLMAEDIRTVLACLEYTELMSLRMISTGVYWFSHQTCDHVCSILGRMTNDPSLAGELPPRLPVWGDLVRLNSSRPSLAYPYFNDNSHLTGPLAIMAVVQEDWATSGPQTRSFVHGLIAKRLAAAADGVPTTTARTLLEDEYPFEVPREGAAVILRSEALRHFVRAADLAEKTEYMMREAQAQFRKLDEAMPIEPPTPEGGLPASTMRNVLSRGGGRYLLKLEILHHLSSDGHGTDPHECLIDDIKERYHSEIGIVNLALLRMAAAETALSKGMRASQAGRRPWYNSALHLAATHILRANWAEAEQVLDEVDETAQSGDLDGRVGTRIGIQRAALALAQGQISEALECVQRELLADLSDLPIGDDALTVIDVLLAASNTNPSALTMASILVEIGADELRAKSLPHEIMRFEIRRARCMTALGQPYTAERILDQVSFEFSKHGGSPRTLHDFQIAGGECLLELGWPEWALSGYLMPSLERALGAKAYSNARQAAELAHIALDQIEARLEAESGVAQVDGIADRMKMARAFARFEPGAQIPVVREWQLRSGERSAKLWERLDPKAKKSPHAPDPFYTNDLSVFKEVRDTGAGDLVEPGIRKAIRAEIQRVKETHRYARE